MANKALQMTLLHAIAKFLHWMQNNEWDEMRTLFIVFQIWSTGIFEELEEVTDVEASRLPWITNPTEERIGLKKDWNGESYQSSWYNEYGSRHPHASLARSTRDDVPNDAGYYIAGGATVWVSLCSGSRTVGTPSGLSASTEDDLRASRRSRFSWAFRVLSISLRRFSNVFLFFAILILLGNPQVSRNEEPMSIT